MNIRCDTSPNQNALARGIKMLIMAMSWAVAFLLTPAWGADNTQKQSNTLLNATPSIPNNQRQNTPSAPITPSTPPGNATASSTAPPQATPTNPQAPTSGMPGVPTVPPSLITIEQTGKRIYQAAKRNNLGQAQQQLQTLKHAYSQLAASVNQPNIARHLPSQAKGHGGATGQLASTINLLQKSLNAKNRWAVMDYANQVVLSAANLSANFNAHVPVNAVLLGVYARYLEIWASKKDMAKLPFTASTLEHTWQMFRPTVMAHNGANAASTFDQLMARLHRARSSSDYAQLAQPIEDAADQIENLFRA